MECNTSTGKSVPITGECAGQVVKFSLLIIVVVLFIVLILKDLVKALKWKAHWIPGDFVVLSAFTIQLLNIISSHGQPLDLIPGNQILWTEFWVSHTSRIMVCVTVAYLMPGMANPGSEESWGKLMALALVIFLHLGSELYIAYRLPTNLPNNPSKEINRVLFIAFATVLSLFCFVMLFLLLGCANIAGRGIERIVAQKIPLVLKDRKDSYSELGEKASEAHHHSCCRTVEKAVLRAQKRKKDLPCDHSCWETVKGLVESMNMEDEDHQQSCGHIVQDIVQEADRQKMDELYKHSCWRTVDDALLRAVKAEEEHHQRHCQDCWKSVEDTVLRAWIVARAYSFDYIIARSALASAAATLVTILIAFTIVLGFLISPGLNIETVRTWLRFTATVLQCVFISIGWFIIIWRSATSVAYYRRWQSADTWRSGFRVEDFWTRHLRELQEAQEPGLPQVQFLHAKVKRTLAKERTTFTVPGKLLYAVIGVQLLTVAFSKVCWVASLMIFNNKLMDKLLSLILSKHDRHAFEDYSKYEEILKGVQMFGETPESLWIANRKSIAKAKNLILQGNEDGEYVCENLLEFLVNRRTRHCIGLHCLEPYKPQAELKYLCKRRSIQRTEQQQEASDVVNQQSEEENGSLAVEEHFTDVSTKSWKMTAVSLLSIIVHLSPVYAKVNKTDYSDSHDIPSKAVKDCLEAYSQAWEIVDFVEETDTETNGITSEAADRYFYILQRKVKNGQLDPSNFRDATPESVRAALDDLKKECASKTEPPGRVKDKDKKDKEGGPSNKWKRVGGNDSIDWKAATSGNAVYKLCNSIQCNDEPDAVNGLLKELESSLADIINECLERVQHLLLLNSKKWARNSDEKRMGKALYAAGKARMIMKMKTAMGIHHSE